MACRRGQDRETATTIGAQRGRPCGTCRCGRAAGRGSGGPSPRRTSAPRADSRGGTSPRTSSGEGEQRSAAAADISAPREQPRGNITMDERRGGGSAAAPVDDAAGRPWRTSPRAARVCVTANVRLRGCVLPQTCGGERERRPATANAAEGQSRRLASRADSRGTTSPRTSDGRGERSPLTRTRPRDGRGDRCPMRTAMRDMSPRTCGVEGGGERRPAAADAPHGIVRGRMSLRRSSLCAGMSSRTSGGERE